MTKLALYPQHWNEVNPGVEKRKRERVRKRGKLEKKKEFHTVRRIADPPLSFAVVGFVALLLLLDVRDNGGDSVAAMGRSDILSSFPRQFPIS